MKIGDYLVVFSVNFPLLAVLIMMVLHGVTGYLVPFPAAFLFMAIPAFLGLIIHSLLPKRLK